MYPAGSVLVYPVGSVLVYPAGLMLSWHLHPTHPDPTNPADPSLCPLQGSGGRSSGEGWRRNGKRLRRGRNGGFSWCLLPPAAHHSLPPEGICRVLSVLSVSPSRGRRIYLCCQAALQSLLLPQVGKTRTNSGAARRGTALAQQAKS